MAGLRISQKQFGERTGWGRGHVQQRYSGAVPLNVAELEHIQNMTGIQLDYLVNERGPRFTPPPNDGALAENESPLSGSNRRALAYSVRRPPALMTTQAAA